MDEERYRGLLDARGMLRTDALSPPPRDKVLTVFAQRDDARVDLATWQRHAARFFETDLGLSVDKRYDPEAPPPEVDVAHLIVAPRDGAGGARLCHARPSTDDDHSAADEADRNAGYTGLATLARRCKYVWLVQIETSDDRIALLVAAILASVVLGPILEPSGVELFGVRTARLKLERRGAPFR